jgi:hypothetical protein
MEEPMWFTVQVDKEDAEWAVDLGNGIISHRAEICLLKDKVMILEKDDSGVYRDYRKLTSEQIERLRQLSQKRKKRRGRRLKFRLVSQRPSGLVCSKNLGA